MKKFKVSYDEEEDILYLGREGIEEEVIELAPGVNCEFNKSGKLIGIEIFRASELLKNILEPMEKRLHII
ncbi:MAG: DUF2283 domain-containing protein [Thermodesulfobacteriota bacterium]